MNCARRIKSAIQFMARSAESNVLNVGASLGMRTKVLTRWVKGSPIAAFIKGDLRRRNIEYEGPDIAQAGPWGVRHQFNIADTGCGSDGGDWMTHKLEHELGGLYDVAHGAGLAAIWGSRAWYVYRNCLPRFRRFAVNVMGVEPVGSDEEIALKGIEAMEAFYRRIHMPMNLRELGVNLTEAEYADMARKCAIGVDGAHGSARLLKEADMLAIYKASL